MEERILRLVRAAASAMGVSVSEFVRQALLERLERLSVLTREVKRFLSEEA